MNRFIFYNMKMKEIKGYRVLCIEVVFESCREFFWLELIVKFR